uniref:RNA-binding protein 42 n=1 Tax=Buteo japonicus TaxID=224669 RepID=A0A8B9Z9V3_9AVES
MSPHDFRIFCGDLGNEVNDDILGRAFGRYPSFLKAKVIRDKRTGKTKGYGFVSFKDPNDYVRAMREMNGNGDVGGTLGTSGGEMSGRRFWGRWGHRGTLGTSRGLGTSRSLGTFGDIWDVGITGKMERDAAGSGS